MTHATPALPSFDIQDSVGAWVPHGRFIVPGAGSGPLAGLRFAAKDVFDVAGHPTGAGNPAWLDTHPVPAANSPIIDTLLQAGATLVGKTLTDELAYSIHGDNIHYGTPRNVKAPGRVPGGSSSGSVAAVAAGLCDFALGTDTGGSTRVPASYCGVWGIRTTHGLLPREGMVPLNPGFDTPTWFAHDPGTFLKVAGCLLPVAGRAGFTRALLLSDALAEADERFHAVAGRVHALLSARLESAIVRACAQGDDLEEWRRTYVTLSGHEAWKAHGAWIAQHKPRFSPAIAGRWQMAQAVSADAAVAAMDNKQRIRDHVRGLLGEAGVAILPSAASAAPTLTATADEVDAIRTRCFRITCIAGLAGLPQVSIPFTCPDGLPVGISLLGPAGSDRALVELAVALFHDLQQPGTALVR